MEGRPPQQVVPEDAGRDVRQQREGSVQVEVGHGHQRMVGPQADGHAEHAEHAFHIALPLKVRVAALKAGDGDHVLLVVGIVYL